MPIRTQLTSQSHDCDALRPGRHRLRRRRRHCHTISIFFTPFPICTLLLLFFFFFPYQLPYSVVVDVVIFNRKRREKKFKGRILPLFLVDQRIQVPLGPAITSVLRSLSLSLLVVFASLSFVPSSFSHLFIKVTERERERTL